MRYRELTLPYWLDRADALLRQTTIEQCEHTSELPTILTAMKENLMTLFAMRTAQCRKLWSDSHEELYQRVWSGNKQQDDEKRMEFRREYLSSQRESDETTLVRAIALMLADHRLRIGNLIHQLDNADYQSLPGVQELLLEEFCPSDAFSAATKIMCGLRGRQSRKICA